MDASYTCFKDSFKLLSETKKLFVYSDLYVYESFPKNKKHLKIIYFDECKNLLENIISANNNEGNIRKKHQKEAMLNICLIDFLITYFYDIKIVNKRRYLSAIRLLNNIRKLLTGWANEKS